MLTLEDLSLSRRFSHIVLPSEGKFYKNKCKKIKLYHLDASDMSVITDRNLLQSGDMIDVLMSRKVAKADDEKTFIDPSQLLSGDREALVVMLRIHLEPILHIPLTDPKTEKTFIHPFDLTSLKTKQISVLPDDDGLFDFTFKKSFSKGGEYQDVDVKFRLTNCTDEKWIRSQQLKDPTRKNDQLILKLTRVIKNIGGNEDKIFIEKFLKQADMSEVLQLNSYLDKVMPGLDMNATAQSPGGETISFKVPFLASFFLPNIN